MARDAVYQGRPMMSARSPPPAKQQHAPASIYSYLHSQSGLHFAPVASARPHDDAGSGSSSPPVRDAASLKGVKYGPGHEKFPSWPGSSDSAPGGGSTRSKSWTDHTNYPKEKAQGYTRPYMKRTNPAYTQQLKTVMERCEKIPPETFESRPGEDSKERLYLPRLDREGKALGDTDYMSPSPPERDITAQLTKADLEEYARSYQDPPLTQVDLEEYMIKPKQAHLTRAELEEYSRSYDESLRPSHQQQPSYAQSEGYHSYVSSTDSTTTTPFLDRLRRDSEATVRPVPGPQTPWDDTSERDHPGRDSVVTTSSGSASSSETLKWHGSLSDVSVASSSCPPNNNSSRQLIAHSSRVQTPQRHHSESVLYLCGGDGWVQRNNNHNKLRLFPVNTYTVQPPQEQLPQSRPAPLSPQQPALSVAERISELERQQQMQTRYTYLDPEKRHRVSDPTLKAIQKKALLSFYERHHAGGSGRSQAWRSEPQLAQPNLVPCPQSPPPQPPPRPRPVQSSRRASSASDYAGGAWREMAANRESANIEQAIIKDVPRHQHSSSCGSLSTDLLGPLIVGPSISLDDWVPERPPKKAHLRAAFPPPIPDRLPSPDLPPPSPPPILEDEVFHSDEPLPPPPSDLTSTEWPSSNLAKPSRPSETIRQPMNQACVPSQQNVDNSFYTHNSANSVRPQDKINSVPRAAENGSVPLRHSSLYTKPQQSFEKTLQTETSPDSEKSGDKSPLEPAITDNTSNLSKRYSPSNSENRMTHHFENAFQTHSSKDNINSLQRNENNVSLQRHSDGVNFSEKNINSTAHKNTENTLPHYWNRNSVSSPQTSPTTDSLGSRFPDTRHDKHSEYETQKQENNSSTLPHKPQENPTLSSKNPENKFSSVFRQQENTFVNPISNVRHSNTNTATARHQWSSNFIQRSLDSVTSSQKYLENGNNSHLLENSFASQRYISNGAPSQRHYNGGPIQKNNDSTNSNHRYSENGLAIHRNNYPSSTAHIHQESGFNFKQGNNGATSPKNNENTIKLSPKKIDSKTGDAANHRPAENGFSVHRYSDGPSLLQKYTSSNVPLQRHFDSGNNVQAQNTNTSSSQRYSQVNPSFVRSTSMKQVDQDDLSSSSLSRFSDQNRSSLRYPTQKLMVNGKLATSLSEWAPSKNGSLRSGDGIRSSVRSVSVMEPSRARLQKVPVLLQSCQSQPSPAAAPRSPPHLSKSEQQAVSRPTHLNQDRGEGNGMAVQTSRPPTHTQQSTSKASYLASHRRDRDRGLPNFEGSYKRTMSPSERESFDTSPPAGNQATAPECERVPSPTDPRESNDEVPVSPSHPMQAVFSTEKKVLVASVIELATPDTAIDLPDQTSLVPRTDETLQTRPAEFPEEKDSVIVQDKVAAVESAEMETQCDMPKGQKVEVQCFSPPPTSPKCQPSPLLTPPQVTGALQLVQRSEVVLRVNAATSDASSQTELDKDIETVVPPKLVRQKLQEELECERLSLDLASHLPPSDKLQGILVPAPEYKKSTDYVSGLFRLDITSRPRPTQRISASNGFANNITSAQNGYSPAQEEREKNDVSPLPASSAYFTTSESKAKFLAQYSEDMSQSDQLGSMDLLQKKEELMSRLDRKLEVLRGEHCLITEESGLNDQLGETVANQVTRLARPHEAAKYRLHVEEVGKITSLLLGLSGRLARAENALVGLPPNDAERKILEGKRDKLREQLEEAKKLKENIDKRSVSVSNILYKYFNEEEYTDYDHFINMKAKLIMDSREIADKIKLGEEQLSALKETLSTPD